MSHSNSASVLNSILSGMVSSYQNAEPSDAKLVRVQVSKGGKTVKVKLPKVKAEKVETLPAIPRLSFPVPATGSLNAETFILALREAGKIRKANDAGIMICLTDSNKERTDQVLAIAGFIGYNPGMSHGTQLDNARRQAQFTLRPTAENHRRTSRASVAGFIAGMPSGVSKVVSDLEGRIRLATDLMLGYDKQAQTAKDEEKPALEAMAAIESERIAHMRRDLSRILGG